MLVAILTVFPGGLGAVAMAQDEAGGPAPSRMDGVAWMNIRDSAGVQLADYTFVSERAGLADPGATVVWTLIGLEFVGYMVIVTTAIWFIGYALSFAWLDLFADALQGAVNAFADRLTTPAVLITATSIGAFFVAWFTVRGFHSRAVAQTLTMLIVAVLGPLYLVSPLAGALGSDGLLTRGRDLGIAVAAGLNGADARNPDLVLSTLQGEMADNFARRPVQVWNFGHIVDDRSACAAAWSAGMTAGDPERTQRELGSCDDTVAVTSAQPQVGQIGTGLILLVSAAVLLLFAVVLSLRLMRAALDAIYQAFMAVFGFAAGGFVYGPTQSFLVRNLVNSGIAAARMCAYTVFVGIYLLLLGNIFQQARGQVVAVIVIAAVVEIVALFQMGRLSKSLTRGSGWVANRFALAVQGAPAGSGGTALGMGGAGGGKGSSGGSGAGVIANLAALNTVNASPLTAWLLGRTLNPLSPLAIGTMRNDRVNIATAASRWESHHWRAMGRQNWRLLARQEAGEWGGIHTELGLNRALKYLENNRVPAEMLPAVLRDAGASHERIHHHMRARQTRDDTRSRNPYGFPPLQKAVASGHAVLNHVGTDAEMAFAAQAVSDADSLARHTLAPAPGAQLDSSFIARVQQHWDSDRALRANIDPAEWNMVGRDTRTAIAHRLATEHLATARAYSAAPTAAHRAELAASLRRLSNLDHTLPEFGLDPWDL
ncbi:hypothetical protein [Nocardia flavorosea]|uniref:Uncharacterized protein n=1 Tax=Nocardia flavorosea TaxID=53429 RepID=A0A846YDA2_9NOCA|nr:hypothetical protein [Nocardia flavorosea]NKY55722.1 hypothetical protein [Nocardia flavorosea]